MQNDAPPDDKHGTEDDDIALFRQQMQGVTPLKPDGRIRTTPKARKPARPRHNDERPVDDGHGFALSDIDSPAPEILNFHRPGPQSSTLKKLRQGKLPIDDHIDLHGLDSEQARRQLIDFLEHCRQQQRRMVLIIHGKGYRSKSGIPVIKARLNQWLRECEQVLAFHSATPRDGGSGALYVLLRGSATAHR